MDRDRAVRIFKERGNMVRIEQVSDLKKLVYPDMEKLNQILSDIYKRADELERKKRDWRKQRGEEKAASEAGILVRLRDPIYRLHLWQKLISPAYRHACRAVSPPFKKIKDHRFRPMLKKFVRDSEYRSKLVESKTGLLAPLSEGGARSVKREMILRRVEEVDRELEREKEYREACMALIDWSKKSSRIFFRKPGKSLY